MKNLVKFELIIDADVCWLSMMTYINQQLTPLLRNIAYTIDIPDSFTIDNAHPRCVEYCSMMEDIDSVLTEEELKELEEFKQTQFEVENFNS